MPWDTRLITTLYVDSSHIETHATVAQRYTISEEKFWRLMRHTSRAWTPAEGGYGQVERKGNGILIGMYMNKMYTLGTHVQVVTDHEPLIPIYSSPNKPKQLNVDRNQTKPFQYDVVYEPGKETACDYGSRHPPEWANFNEDWDRCICQQGHRGDSSTSYNIKYPKKKNCKGQNIATVY